MHLMRRGWLLCPSFFFSSLSNAKLPFSTFGLHQAPFNSTPQLSEVRWASSVPWPTVVVQILYELGKYFLRATHQYSLRSTSSEMPSPPLSTVSGLRPPTWMILKRIYCLQETWCMVCKRIPYFKYIHQTFSQDLKHNISSRMDELPNFFFLKVVLLIICLVKR